MIWKNGCTQSFMYGTEKLTPLQVQKAVNNMSYTGLQISAASLLLLAQKAGFSPKEIMTILDGDDKPSPVTIKDELDLSGGSMNRETRYY